MAKITDFYKIASPSQPVVTVTDNQSLDNSYGAISNTSYHRVIQGGASRLARYNEYNAMDNDVEVARALDITAEEMTGKNTKTNLPLDLEMIKEESQEVDDTLVTTLNAAMRRWCDLHGFNDNRLFKLSRNLAKYGDCFFRKKSPYKRWEWIPAADVMGAVVDAHDVTNVVAYQVRINTKEPTNSSGFASNNYKAVNEIKTEIVPASEMVVFSINDDMSDSAPFGDSVLRTVYKTHKQKELLEDAIIIYRIQRAPERRVFYIDVGKMPPNRVKAYLETVKNEMRQKKIPSMNNNGQASVDSVYNPQSQLEDIYLAQRCIALDTPINIVGIGPLPLIEIIKRHNRGLTHQVYTVNQDTGIYSIGNVSWAGITRHETTIIKLNFNNGDYLECTPDHKLLLNDFTEVEAQRLALGASLCTQGQYEILLESIEWLDELVDTGCITVDTIDNNHNFNIGAGIYIKNSDGAGSKVDVLQSGCLSLDTKIDLLSGHSKTLSEMIDDFENGIENWVISCNPNNGSITAGIVSWAGITQKDAGVVELLLSNDEKIICTPDHKFPVYDKGFVPACELTSDDVIMANDIHIVEDNIQLYDNKLKKYINIIDLYKHYDIDENYFKGPTQYDNIDNASDYVKGLVVKEYTVLDTTMDVGTLTIDQDEKYHNYHTFGLSCGIFTKNSQLGEQSDLDYFADKVLRGLRVPLSYMKPGDKNTIFNDGKMGSAFVEEIQFAKYVERLQIYVEDTLDKEFKKFLFHCNINIDPSLYKIRLPKPSSYKQYQQAEIDNTLLSMVGTADGLPSLSKRFVLQRYLQLSEADMLLNEQLLKEERGLSINADKTLQTLYGQPGDGGMMGGGMGMGADMGMGGMGGDMSGMGGDMSATGAEGGMGAGPAPGGAPPAGGTPPPIQ